MYKVCGSIVQIPINDSYLLALVATAVPEFTSH